MSFMIVKPFSLLVCCNEMMDSSFMIQDVASFASGPSLINFLIAKNRLMKHIFFVKSPSAKNGSTTIAENDEKTTK